MHKVIKTEKYRVRTNWGQSMYDTREDAEKAIAVSAQYTHSRGKKGWAIDVVRTETIALYDDKGKLINTPDTKPE